MAGKSLIKRLLSLKILGASLGGAAVLFVGGVVAWGAFNTGMEATNTLEFCVSCHEMEQTVYQEYKESVHYENRTGVRATCPDCHVPHPWVHKIVRKIQASNELLHKALGSINTQEKFEAKRPILAANEWRRMKNSDSRECRNCHSFTAMNRDKQKKRAGKQHETAIADGQTCIDCHKGIAHRKPNDDGSPLPTWASVVAQRGAAAAGAQAQTQMDDPKNANGLPAGTAPGQAGGPAAAPAGAQAGGGVTGIDWNALPGKAVTLLYPGQTSYEWVQNGPQHGGARAYTKKGEKCSGCHEGEQADMGKKMATGEKAETTPIPGKPGSIKMTVKAAHDDENLYMQFSWPASPHTPAPFAQGGKMDPDNQIKLALMIDQGKVQDAERSGCWSTCHSDIRSMPDAPGADKAKALAGKLDVAQGVTKYLPQTRTAIEIAGSPQGGWDKLKGDAELEQLMKDGVFLDLLRWKSGGGGVSEDGHVSAQRLMAGGQGVSFTGSEAGGTWAVTMVRKLKSDKPGDVSIEAGKTYTVGFALHDDFTSARFHHVSIDYTLALDNAEAAINAVKVTGAKVSAPGKAAAAPAAAPAAASASVAAPANAAVPAKAAAPAGNAGAAKVDWSKASEKKVALFYPGQTSYEWVQNGPQHGGARAYTKKGEKCSGCHEGEQADMGKKMASGEKAETTPIPGKPGSIPLTVRATHDNENLYMQFSWPASPHTPAPFAQGGKMDPDNQIKLALMIDQGKVQDAERSGCWSTCHSDIRSMPDAPGADKAKALAGKLDVAQGVTKYLPQSRTAIEISGSPQGGWDKLKGDAELEQLMKDGVFLDLLRWKSGGGGVSEDGHVSAQRLMAGGQGVSFSGGEAGGTWTVTMVRKLKSDKPGDVSIEAGKTYTVGFALHDDFTNARFHHVSIDYAFALDNAEAAINATKQ